MASAPFVRHGTNVVGFPSSLYSFHPCIFFFWCCLSAPFVLSSSSCVFSAHRVPLLRPTSLCSSSICPFVFWLTVSIPAPGPFPLSPFLQRRQFCSHHFPPTRRKSLCLLVVVHHPLVVVDSATAFAVSISTRCHLLHHRSASFDTSVEGTSQHTPIIQSKPMKVLLLPAWLGFIPIPAIPLSPFPLSTRMCCTPIRGVISEADFLHPVLARPGRLIFGIHLIRHRPITPRCSCIVSRLSAQINIFRTVPAEASKQQERWNKNRQNDFTFLALSQTLHTLTPPPVVPLQSLALTSFFHSPSPLRFSFIPYTHTHTHNHTCPSSTFLPVVSFKQQHPYPAFRKD